MVIKNVSLDIVCGITSKIPDTGRPEVAFAGKSNVGKSSLINGLMNRKALARTSAQPGKTQTIIIPKSSGQFFFWWISATNLLPMTSRCMTGSATTDMNR